MAKYYCVCNSSSYPSDCDCKGTSYQGKEGDRNAGKCDDYTSGKIENRKFANSNTCKAYVPSQTIKENEYEFNGNYYSVKNTGDIVYASDYQSLWNYFLNTVVPHFKSLSYTYSSAPDDLAAEHFIKHEHLEYLRQNLIDVYSTGGNYHLVTGQGHIKDKKDNNKIANYQNDTASNYFSESQVISKNDINRVYTWITAAYANCECVQNNFKDCCYCNVVCDCNY